VDAVSARLTGTVSRVAAPPRWPWLAVGAVFAAAAALLLALRTGRELRRATVAFGWIAAGAAAASAIGFAASSSASEQTWVEAATELSFLLLGVVLLAHGSLDSRALSGALVGLFALAIGLTDVSVLFHGLVLSALPGALARTAVTLSIAAGAAAVVCGLVVFVDVLAHYEEPASLDRHI
jgi:hypothetical protein